MIARLKIKKLALFISEFCFVGRIPFAPGTFGSLASLAIWVPALYFQWPLFLRIILLVALFFLGVWTSPHAINHYGVPDPKQVVLDEVVGQGIPFLVIPPTPLAIVFSFALFRFFDILKPWPIALSERVFPDKWAIMIDDVIAGLFAMLIMYMINKYAL